MKLITGLGNPGSRYEDTRHNIGARVARHFAVERGIRCEALRFSGRFGSAVLDGLEIAVLLPETFMNRVGDSVLPALHELGIDEPSGDLLAIYDDLDLPFGRLRLRPGGGSGGHRGMADLIEKIGTQDFPRLRFGVGRPPPEVDPVEYVLAPFEVEEREHLGVCIDQAALAVEFAIRDGITAAMNRFNRPTEEESRSDLEKGDGGG